MTDPKCPFCGQAVPKESIGLAVTCLKCGRTFAGTDLVTDGSPGSRKPDLQKPDDLEVMKEGLDLTITWFWFSFVSIPLALFCALWDLILVWMVRGIPAAFLFVLLGHALVAAVLTYVTLAKLLNRTELRAGPKAITVRHAPFPWAGGKSIRRDIVEQLFCVEQVRRGKRGRVFRTFDIVAGLKGGPRTDLITGLDSRERALYIEQQLESHLGIQDRPMPGETRQFGAE